MAYIFKHYSKTTPTGTGIVFTAYKLPSYSITYNLTNLISDATNPATIGSGETASIIITAPTGYNLPSKIIVTGCEYTWEANTGVLDISNPTGNVTIAAEGVAETYSVTVRLTGVTGESTNPTTVSYGGSATFKFTAKENYDLPAGVEQTGATSYNWNKTTGTLVLANITGPVTITIVGVATVPQLATPTGLIADGTTIKWDEVTNATSYDIYVDGGLYENTTGGQGYKLTLTNIYLNAGNTVSVHISNADGTSTTANTLSNGMSWENVKSFYITDTYGGVKKVTINGTDADMPTQATPYTLTQDTSFTFDNTCLTGDMLVTLADGSEKQICELTSDDTYLAYDFTTGDLTAAKAEYIDAVNGHSGKFANKYQKYTFEDGTVIKEVHKHRFLNLRKMEFINLCDWEIGDRIYKIDGTTPALISKEVITEEVEHFTVTTAKYHNGFVQGCLYGDRYTQKYGIHMIDGKPVYDFSKPHTMDYLYGKVPQND